MVYREEPCRTFVCFTSGNVQNKMWIPKIRQLQQLISHDILKPRRFYKREATLLQNFQGTTALNLESESTEASLKATPLASGVLYDGHEPTNFFQKALLAAGSATIALMDPTRADMIAVNGETTGYYAIQNMHQKMMNDSEGRMILEDKPRIGSKTIDLDALRSFPPNTLAQAYMEFLDKNQVSPDTRLPVQFVDNPELAYVMQRYREAHDLVHTLLGMPTNMLGEVAVKWVEGMQTGLPMCIAGGLFGPLRFRPKQRQKYLNVYLPWALRVGGQAKFLLNIYFEKRWEQNMDDLRRELYIEPCPIVV